MENKQQLTEVLNSYKKLHAGELPGLSLLQAFLNSTQGPALFDRKNFNGHLTASAIITNSSRSKILLIYHDFLKRWLQPGGHVEPDDDTIFDAAIREIEEETGLKRSELKSAGSKTIPFDIDSHLIPANPKKGEEEHYHHDFKYLFVYDPENPDTEAAPLSANFQWAAFEQLNDDLVFRRIIHKLSVTDP